MNKDRRRSLLDATERLLLAEKVLEALNNGKSVEQFLGVSIASDQPPIQLDYVLVPNFLRDVCNIQKQAAKETILELLA